MGDGGAPAASATGWRGGGYACTDRHPQRGVRCCVKRRSPLRSSAAGARVPRIKGGSASGCGENNGRGADCPVCVGPLPTAAAGRWRRGGYRRAVAVTHGRRGAPPRRPRCGGGEKAALTTAGARDWWRRHGGQPRQGVGAGRAAKPAWVAAAAGGGGGGHTSNRGTGRGPAGVGPPPPRGGGGPPPPPRGGAPGGGGGGGGTQATGAAGAATRRWCPTQPAGGGARRRPAEDGQAGAAWGNPPHSTPSKGSHRGGSCRRCGTAAAHKNAPPLRGNRRHHGRPCPAPPRSPRHGTAAVGGRHQQKVWRQWRARPPAGARRLLAAARTGGGVRAPAPPSACQLWRFGGVAAGRGTRGVKGPPPLPLGGGPGPGRPSGPPNQTTTGDRWRFREVVADPAVDVSIVACVWGVLPPVQGCTRTQNSGRNRHRTRLVTAAPRWPISAPASRWETARGRTTSCQADHWLVHTNRRSRKI